MTLTKKTAKQRFGGTGENIATQFLTENNYTILKRNYRYSKNEIDIICKKDRFLVFVEVKTRSDTLFGTPEDQVSSGVTPGYVRLSIGIEHIDDILADLDQALQKI